MIKQFLRMAVYVGMFLTWPAMADIDFEPRSGVLLQPRMNAASIATVRMLPVDNQKSLRYRLTPLKGPGGAIVPQRVQVRTPFSPTPQTLDKFRVFLSGRETGPLTIEFLTDPSDWSDRPGSYVGRLIPDRTSPEIPVTLKIRPNSVISLRPERFVLRPSLAEDPVITEVDISVASNSRRWVLAMVLDKLEKTPGNIGTERVFARIKKPGKANPWISMNKPFWVAEGAPGLLRKIATLEFFIESRRSDPTGYYEGNIRFLIRNEP